MTVTTCVACTHYLTDRPRVCIVCRTRMARDLDDLLNAYLELDAEPGRAGGPRVTGTREKPLPARVTVLDLQLRATSQQAIRDPHGDQVGHVPVATILAGWVQAWAEKLGEKKLPVPTVPLMVLWLKSRLDSACDRCEGIADYAGEIRQTLRACKAAMGDIPEREEWLPIVPCPVCDTVALHRRPGSDLIHCVCPHLLTRSEFQEQVKLQLDRVRLAQSV